MTDTSSPRIAVLASGAGSNLQGMLDDPVIGDLVCLVVSDRPQALAIQRAHRAGVMTAIFQWNEYSSRNQFSAAIAEVLNQHGVTLVVLAGFMRVLTAELIDPFRGRVLNIHPSLLPAFPGAHAVENALAHGAKVTGVTVHIVEEAVDAGPIIAQVPVEIETDDSVESLHARIQKVEHQLYPEAVRAFVEGRLVVNGREVRWV